MVTDPDSVGPVCASMQHSLLRHRDQDPCWQDQGVEQGRCAHPRSAMSWRGWHGTATQVPGFGEGQGCLAEQGVKILGAPLGHQDYVRQFLSKVSEKHQILFQRIPRLSDVQSAWLLLVHCAGTRANYTLRCIDPESAEAFASKDDQDMFACLCQILQVSPDAVDAETWDSATLPMSLGGLAPCEPARQPIGPVG